MCWKPVFILIKVRYDTEGRIHPLFPLYVPTRFINNFSNKNKLPKLCWNSSFKFLKHWWLWNVPTDASNASTNEQNLTGVNKVVLFCKVVEMHWKKKCPAELLNFSYNMRPSEGFGLVVQLQDRRQSPKNRNILPNNDHFQIH